jgi:hypothetical protein
MTGFGYNINGFGSGGSGAPALYAFTDAQFRPTLNGYAGPSLTQARTGLTGTGVNAWKNDTQFFNTSSGIQLWVVPVNGNYRIEVWGAQGYSGPAYASGAYGARMRGDFNLSSGQIIKILVGQTGANTYGGGGGGTFVATSANSPLIVAGGGNNASPWSSVIRHGSTGINGTDGSQSGYAGTNGNGGQAVTGAHGGAGFLTDSQSSFTYSQKPLAFVNGGVGGSTCNGHGGFGGGSGTDGCNYGASGAGGGYSGGGGTSTSSQYSGAGGSFNGGSNQSNSNGNTGTATLSGNGKVIITAL